MEDGRVVHIVVKKCFAFWQIDASVVDVRVEIYFGPIRCSMLDLCYRMLIKKRERKGREKRNEERKVANNDLLRIRTNRRKMNLCDSVAGE